MSKNLLDLSGKIDDFTLGLLENIATVAESLGVPFFVVGATARDMILTHCYGIQTIRATHDIDFGVQVPDWEQYERLKEDLVTTRKFNSTNQAQRLLYKDSLLVDIIPFGPIAEFDNSLRWPPDHETEMNILGFEESYNYSLIIRLRADPVLELKFANLAGLAIMKIISWNDKYPERNRDAKDLALLMRTYLDAGNNERLFNEDLMVS